jgi:membrane associated rhomboid family serine protease
MGLYDRDYMRDEPTDAFVRRRGPRKPWSPTIVLLVVLAIVYVVQIICLFGPRIPLEYYGGLSLNGIRQGHLWQLLSFQFLHGGILHLLLNGMTLYSFGRLLEQELGRGRFLALYFLSGTAGGLLQMLATWLLRQPAEIPVVGASAGISGLLGAFILTYPDARLILFPIPFKIRAWTLLWIVLGVSIIGTVFPFGGIAHAAHLGGLLAGGAFIRWLWRRNFQSGLFNPSPKSTPPRTTPAAPPPTTDDFIEREVNPILEKIATHGLHSLTERERRTLEEARKRMKS